MENLLFVTDFNSEPLVRLMNNDETSPKVDVSGVPYGQVMQVLLNPDHQCWQNDNYDFAVIWTRPEGVSEAYRRAKNFERVSHEEVLGDVEQYIEAVKGIRDRVESVLVPTWVRPAWERGYGMLDMDKGLGLANLLKRMNLHLADAFTDVGGVYTLESSHWFERSDGFDPRTWYMGKIGFSNSLFKEAIGDLKSVLRGLIGAKRKIIILDLDETLWGGIVGDDGWENLRLGGHDPVGEALVDFQRQLKALKRRGIVLGIVSKNEKQTALEAIDEHPEMVLGREDFVGWRINWEDKARNVASLMEELNLGLDSAVFIDDNPVERNRVREALPDVLVPDWPNNKLLYSKALSELRCFNAPSLSDEDSRRTEMYRARRKREGLKEEVASVDNWLETLNTTVKVEPFCPSNRQRIGQLFNKTNQMNMKTRRMPVDELDNWQSKKNRELFGFRVSDKFGDSGLAGVASLELEQKCGEIVDFILSCRVMGRKVEETMLYVLIQRAQKLELNRLVADFVHTEKNKPCYRFWTDSRFEHDEQTDRFIWEVGEREYQKPDPIELILEI